MTDEPTFAELREMADAEGNVTLIVPPDDRNITIPFVRLPERQARKRREKRRRERDPVEAAKARRGLKVRRAVFAQALIAIERRAQEQEVREALDELVAEGRIEYFPEDDTYAKLGTREHLERQKIVDDLHARRRGIYGTEDDA